MILSFYVGLQAGTSGDPKHLKRGTACFSTAGIILPMSILATTVGKNDHLSHDRGERDLRAFPSMDQVAVCRRKRVRASDTGDGAHIKCVADVLRPPRIMRFPFLIPLSQFMGATPAELRSAAR